METPLIWVFLFMVYKDLMKEFKNEINIELIYNLINNEDHSISFYTRSTCSVAQVEIISYIIKTLYPNDVFEILSLPAQPGSFKDRISIKFTKQDATLLILLLGFLMEAILFPGQMEADKSNKRESDISADLQTLEIIEKCKDFDLGEEEIEMVKDICASYYPKTQKNTFYETLISDKNIISIKSTATKDNENIFEDEIKRIDFEKYIEKLPKEKEFLKTDLSGNIQLSQPFIDKQQQYGRGAAWRGIYYGNDIFDDNGELIVEDGEYIYFYMQDDEYKKQILGQEISFTSGDNIRVIFDISHYYDFINGKFGKARLYVKKVLSHNDDLVQHKKDLALKKAKKQFKEENKNQTAFFDITQDNND